MSKTEMTSAICDVHPDRIGIRGLDLCQDLIGNVGFTEYFLLLLTGTRPSQQLIAITDATLVAIAEHGLVPSVVAARMTYAAAPDALQGAVAAGLLGCGPVILGASESAGRLLIELLKMAAGSSDLDAAAIELMTRMHAEKKFLPGFGHPIHRDADPRAARLLAVAENLGLKGVHCAALAALERHAESVYGRHLPMNVSAAIPAVLLDAGYPAAALKGIPMLARCASLIAHLHEEATQRLGFALAAAATADVRYQGPDRG